MILFISCSIGIPTIDASWQRITGPRRATRSCSSNIHISAVTVKVNVPRLPHFLACLTSSALRLLLVPMIRAHATTPSPTMTANRRFSRKLSANHAPCNCNSSRTAHLRRPRKICPNLKEEKSPDHKSYKYEISRSLSPVSRDRFA